MDTRHLASEERISSIEAQLAMPGMQPQALMVQSTQPDCIQHQAVLLLEQGTAATGLQPPPVPPLLRHVYNITPSAPPQQHLHYQPELVADKVPPPSKFCGKMKYLDE